MLNTLPPHKYKEILWMVGKSCTSWFCFILWSYQLAQERTPQPSPALLGRCSCNPSVCSQETSQPCQSPHGTLGSILGSGQGWDLEWEVTVEMEISCGASPMKIGNSWDLIWFNQWTLRFEGIFTNQKHLVLWNDAGSSKTVTWRIPWMGAVWPWRIHQSSSLCRSGLGGRVVVLLFEDVQ